MFLFKEDTDYICTYCDNQGKWRLVDDSNKTILFICEDHKIDLFKAICKISLISFKLDQIHHIRT